MDPLEVVIQAERCKRKGFVLETMGGHFLNPSLSPSIRDSHLAQMPQTLQSPLLPSSNFRRKSSAYLKIRREKKKRDNI